MAEARKQVARQQRQGRLDDARAAQVLLGIRPQTDDAGFDQVDIVVEAIVENLDLKRQVLGALQPSGPRSFTAAEIVDRIMLPMIVEADHALGEGVAQSPAALDRAMLLGLGFPAHAGGPLQYADWLGLEEVVARCERLRHLGAAYEPTARMRQLAAKGGRFRAAN